MAILAILPPRLQCSLQFAVCSLLFVRLLDQSTAIRSTSPLPGGRLYPLFDT